uniref:Uncharacterized protein C17orf39 n=1 Tax=Aceria tosichella TaxID=561515 RepID=A0A6G1SJK1_9ACAR
MLEFKVGMCNCLEGISANSLDTYKPRTGVNLGPVTNGLIGSNTTKQEDDNSGNMVNVTRRMESSCEPSRVQITEDVYMILKKYSTNTGIKLTHKSINSSSNQSSDEKQTPQNEQLQNEPTAVVHDYYKHKQLDTIDYVPPYINSHQVGVIKNHLFDGSSFSGFQKSQNENYEVNVKIQHVDYDSSYLCGYLCIAHLTKSHPSLTTFFEGEIISEKYPFRTRKWEATEEIDLAHWSMFEDFRENYSLTFNCDSFDYDKLKNSDYIYMRWKERFLVPDHKVKHVEGASYAGFYYICYSKRTSQIEGYYFHINSEYTIFESFQSLNLELDCNERSSQVYQFR